MTRRIDTRTSRDKALASQRRLEERDDEDDINWTDLTIQLRKINAERPDVAIGGAGSRWNPRELTCDVRLAEPDDMLGGPEPRRENLRGWAGLW